MIRGNDRNFDALSGCTPEAQSRAVVDPIAPIDARFLDVETTRADVNDALRIVGEAIDEYRNWLVGKESDFEVVFWVDAVPLDSSLLSNVSRVISRLKRDRAILSRWHTEFQEKANDVLGSVAEYDELRAQLVASIGPDAAHDFSTTFADLTPLAIARRNVSSVRATQRLTTRLLRAEARLRDRSTRFRTLVDAFSRGVLRTEDGRTIDLAETGRAIDELAATGRGGGTPLARVQDAIARRIAEKGLAVTGLSLRARRAPLQRIMPLGGADDVTAFVRDASRKGGGGYVTSAEIVERTRRMVDEILYTENTRPLIDMYADVVLGRVAENDPARVELVDLINRLRRNYPNVVINELLGQARREDGLFLRIERVNGLLRNLDPGDRVYETPLREILREMQELARRRIYDDNDDDAR